MDVLIGFEFKPQDCWIGMYWKKEYRSIGKNWYRFNIWICLLPMLPLHIGFGNYPLKEGK